MDNNFDYNDVLFFQNLKRFIPSEEQAKARRNYLAALMIFGLIQLLGETPKNANMLGLEIDTNHMDSFIIFILLVFSYLLFIYRTILYENFSNYISANINSEHYFYELNRLDFTRKLQSIHRGLLPEDALVIASNNKYSILRYTNIFPHPAWENVIPGYDKAEKTYTYEHTEIDWIEYEKRKPNLRPSFAYTYLAFRLPIVVGYGLLAWFVIHKIAMFFIA